VLVAEHDGFKEINSGPDARNTFEILMNDKPPVTGQIDLFRKYAD
jgi:hypothetical protein